MVTRITRIGCDHLFLSERRITGEAKGREEIDIRSLGFPKKELRLLLPVS